MNVRIIWYYPVQVIAAFTFISLMFNVQAATGSSGLAEYEQPWEICALCHSLDGNSHMAKFPKLAGQPKLYIEKQLRNFLTGSRSNDGGQMSAIVTEVAEGDFEAIAIWFSSQESPLPSELPLEERIHGQTIFHESGCIECHVVGRQSEYESEAVVPILESQHAQYLRKQINDFIHGGRTHISTLIPTDPVMELTESEIDALVDYLAATARE